MEKELIMEINHETAMLLWKKRYGKATKVKDFSGREMDKGSYGNRNSDYGWNLDHILPQSQGGKDTESNLVCCHIITNDEKADKFPVFKANEKTFEIIKVENHYEIKQKSPDENRDEEEIGINFFDYSAGISFIKDHNDIDFFIGLISIKITDATQSGILNFVNEVFGEYDIDFEEEGTFYRNQLKSYIIRVRVDDIKTRETINGLLDDCVLLNTYFKYYFKRLKIITGFDIVFNAYCLHDLCQIQNFSEPPVTFKTNECSIHINDLVRRNSEAKKMEIDYEKESYSYNYTYTRLRENLSKVEE